MRRPDGLHQVLEDGHVGALQVGLLGLCGDEQELALLLEGVDDLGGLLLDQAADGVAELDPALEGLVDEVVKLLDRLGARARGAGAGGLGVTATRGEAGGGGRRRGGGRGVRGAGGLGEARDGLGEVECCLGRYPRGRDVAASSLGEGGSSRSAWVGSCQGHVGDAPGDAAGRRVGEGGRLSWRVTHLLIKVVRLCIEVAAMVASGGGGIAVGRKVSLMRRGGTSRDRARAGRRGRSGAQRPRGAGAFAGRRQRGA